MPRKRTVNSHPITTSASDATAKHPAPGQPVRRRGGQELPDEVQDRPEQNAGYDEAVRSGAPGTPVSPLGLDDLEPGPEERAMNEELEEPQGTADTPRRGRH